MVSRKQLGLSDADKLVAELTRLKNYQGAGYTTPGGIKIMEPDEDIYWVSDGREDDQAEVDRSLRQVSQTLDLASEELEKAKTDLTILNEVTLPTLQESLENTAVETEMSMAELEKKLHGITAGSGTTVADTPPDRDGRADGEIWWQLDEEKNILGQWTWTGEEWSEVKLDSDAIAKIDVSKLVTTEAAGIPEAVISRIWADGIVARTLAATSVAVAASNGYRDPDLTNPGQWGTFYSPEGGYLGGGSIVVPEGTDQRGSYDALAASLTFPRTTVAPDDTYMVGAWVKPDKAVTESTSLCLYVRAYDSQASSSYMNIVRVAVNSGPITAGTWTWIEGAVKIPPTATNIAVGCFANPTYTGSASFSGITVRRAVGSVLIKDGAVSADKLAANSVSSDKIVANAITGREIKALSVTADHLAANTITGNKIAANTITGDKILANTVSADKFSGGSFSGKTFSGGTFSGSSFIGGVYATSMYPGTDGGVMIDAANGLRGWAKGTGGPTFQLSPSTGEVSIAATLKATNSKNQGVMLVPTTTSGGGGLWFTEDGTPSGNAAAIWRSDYKVDAYQPLNLRGANGGGLNITGPVSISQAPRTGLSVRATYIDNMNGGIGTGSMEADDMWHRNPPTTSAGANCLIASSPEGRFYKSTSSIRYKKNVVNWRPNPKRVLELQPRQWQHDDPNFPDDIDERWHVGFVAEEVADLGLKQLVTYVGDGRGGWIPDGLQYDRFAAAQQVVLKDHEERIAELETENAELRARLDRIEAKLNE